MPEPLTIYECQTPGCGHHRCTYAQYACVRCGVAAPRVAVRVFREEDVVEFVAKAVVDAQGYLTGPHEIDRTAARAYIGAHTSASKETRP